MKANGFTLVEVLISMVIMSFLALVVATSIRTSVQNKQKIEARMRDQTRLYDALRVMKMDIERAFNYQDVFFEIENLAIQQLELEKQKTGAPPSPPRPAPPHLTHFLGEESSLHFTTLNHFRTRYNAKESDQIEVGYFLDGCTPPGSKTSTKCLWRRYSTVIDDRVDEGGKKIVVAPYVTKLRFSYRGNEENEEWKSQWRSDNKGRPDHQRKFPYQVKIEMEVHDSEDKSASKYTETMVVNVQFPNNEPYMQGQGNQQANQQGQGRRN
ncbi:MAG: prepilin-type N-terminal cleavage/methylation domain-containing protein [Bdellovibrionales bacterium]|nr:prepilin-type N-terminal cleavage/methylation domain-containing protein [Bdellovibrionales bacterium]